MTRCLLFNSEMCCSGGDTVYVLCVFVCLSVRSERDSRSDRQMLNFLFGKMSSPRGETCWCGSLNGHKSKRLAAARHAGESIFISSHMKGVADGGRKSPAAGSVLHLY